MTDTHRIVFDVESVGLHGEGFAVGAVRLGADGVVVADFYAACPSEAARGSDSSRVWLAEHCLPTLPPPTHATPREVREAFWRWWKRAGGSLWADCGWPVEARFLIACVDDDPAAREWEGPYPLHEISEHIGMHTYSRLPDELPAHNPLNDARQSARLLVARPS